MMLVGTMCTYSTDVVFVFFSVTFFSSFSEGLDEIL